MALWLSWALCARARQTVSIAWDPDPDPGVAGYAVYVGNTPGTFFERVDVGAATMATLPGFQEGQTNYFSVAAYNRAGVEGARSGELAYVVPGILKMQPMTKTGGLANISFPVASGHYYEVQATTDFQNWTSIAATGLVTSNGWVQISDPASRTFSHRFYRLAMDPLPEPQWDRTTSDPSTWAVKFPTTAGHWYELEASTDMKNWTVVAQTGTVVSNGWFRFLDPQRASFKQRFYRLAVDRPNTLALVPGKATGNNLNSLGNTTVMSVKFAVAPGHWYEVQATQDLMNWTTIGQTGRLLTNGVVSITDANSTFYRQRFYRVVLH